MRVELTVIEDFCNDAIGQIGSLAQVDLTWEHLKFGYNKSNNDGK